MPVRLPIVGVMGSGSSLEHAGRAEELGRWLASENVHLLTGGGAGLMEVVSRAFHSVPGRRGLIVGVLPSSRNDPGQAKKGYPNPWVELPIYTHLSLSGKKGTDPLSRNHINVLSSDVIVALPGGRGTSSEVQLAVLYERPIAAYLETPAQIPGLMPGLRVLGTFTEVQDFVRAALSLRLRSAET
jgi:uncharacterized protein (TIGR00725 family)